MMLRVQGCVTLNDEHEHERHVDCHRSQRSKSVERCSVKVRYNTEGVSGLDNEVMSFIRTAFPGDHGSNDASPQRQGKPPSPQCSRTREHHEATAKRMLSSICTGPVRTDTLDIQEHRLEEFGCRQRKWSGEGKSDTMAFVQDGEET